MLDKNYVGLYRDDGLAVIRNTTPSEKERIKKKIWSKISVKTVEPFASTKKKKKKKNCLYCSCLLGPIW